MPVLYRTYRPTKWSEVIGQEHIVTPLRESIEAKRIAHAYLFHGSRGTGKTSVARIFAKSIGTADEDIYEIDAASNRGIDNIRELREHVSIVPFSSKYKVYIIDEVHMLSKDAWNALLKTLEEPPTHALFILATTELDKVPDTIISRCQTYTFKRPSREVIRKHIASIAKKEGFDIDVAAAELIALLGDGSFRDSLGVLEKVISSAGAKKINREHTESVTGAPRNERINELVQCILSKNADKALSVLMNMDTSGDSCSTSAMLLLEKMRYILLAQYSTSSHSQIREKVSAEDAEFIITNAHAKTLTPRMLSTLIGAIDMIPRSPIPTLPLEIALVDMCA